MKTSKLLSLTSLLILCISVGRSSFAQVYNSRLVGTVSDKSGAVIPDCRIVATEIRTGVETAATSDERGEYRMTTLRPGEYKVTVTKAGFKTKVLSNIRLTVGEATRVDLPLEVGEVTETLSVTGETPLVQTETSERSTTLQHTEITALPLSTRNFVELTYLTPGALKGGYGGNVSNPGDPQPMVNGLQSYSNQFNVDGVSLTSTDQGKPVERFTIDTIEEFKIETSNPTADHGLQAGATVSIATKHGTNDFHGAAFEFLRNDALNARNFFSQTIPPLRYNQFGGTVGGPIVKNKLFFQATYEGSREHRAQTVQSTVPTDAEREGIFTLGTGNKGAPNFNPYDVDPATGLRNPFPNNTIPASMINPIAKNYLAIWPRANQAGFPNYIYNAATINNYDRYALRVDYTISANDTIMARFGHQGNESSSPGPVPNSADGNAGAQGGIGTSASGTWTHLFGPLTINTVGFSYAYNHYAYLPDAYVGQNIPKEWGFENADRVPKEVYGLPSISFSGGVSTAGLGNAQIADYPDKTYYITENLELLRGSHDFKIGLLHFRHEMNSYYGYAGGSAQNFTGLYTSQMDDLTGGQPFADFLLGALGGLRVNENVQFSHVRKNAWQMYFQDNWKVSSRLNVQLGLRYDVNLPAYATDGHAAGWVDGLGSRTGQVAIFPKNADGPLQQILGGTDLGFPYQFADNNWLQAPHWRNLGPRVGVAYRPFGDTKTVIRGGYGLYYDMYISTVTTDRNYGRPFFTSDFTPARPTAQENPPPYTLGDAPVISAAFPPGSQYRSGYTFYKDWPDTQVHQWNVTVQRELRPNLMIEGAYVGSNLAHMTTWWGDHNRAKPVGYTFHYDDGSTFTVTDATPLLERVKYPELRTGTTVGGIGHGNYNAFQLQVIKQMSHGLQFRTGYTRSRTYGLLPAGSQAFQDEWNTSDLNYYSSTDLTNVFFTTFVYQLPGAHLDGAAGMILGGWQLGGIVSVHTGPRVNPSEGFPQFEGASSVQPVMLKDPNLPSSQRNIDQWFDTTAFAQPGPNEFGSDSSYYAIRAPGLRNFDMSLSKYLKLGETRRIQIRGEFYNLFNHPYFLSPNTTRGTATFGKITSAGPAREVQLGIKFEF